MLVGGSVATTSVEIIKKDGTNVCQLERLPHGQFYATQDGYVHCVVVNCYTYRENPLQFITIFLTSFFLSEGVWVKTHKIAGRWGHLRKHSSWSSPNGIILLGMDIEAGADTTEILTSDGQATPSFTLAKPVRWSCSIQFPDKVITTGGYPPDKAVVEYNEDGFVKYLPDLTEPRYAHGCSSYLDDDQNDVMIVVGGTLDTTEKLVYGESSWIVLGPTTYKSLLTGAFVAWDDSGVRVSNIENQLIATENKLILKFNKDTGDWTEIGRTQESRHYHTSSVITMKTRC